MTRLLVCVLAVLLVLFTVAPQAATAQPPGDPRMKGEGWTGSKLGGPGSQAHPNTPQNDDRFYSNRPSDVHPVLIGAAIAAVIAAMIGLLLLVRRKARAALRLQRPTERSESA